MLNMVRFVEEALNDEILELCLPQSRGDSYKLQLLKSVRDVQIRQAEAFDEYSREKMKLKEKYYALRESISEEMASIAASLPQDFWFRAIMNCSVVSENVTDEDKIALSYLKLLECHVIFDDPKDRSSRSDLPPGSYILTFHFRDNPFFENDILTKTYRMERDDHRELDKAIGTSILWKPGKDLTVKFMRKKNKNGREMTKRTKTDSFFNFFSPLNLSNFRGRHVGREEYEEVEDVIDADFEIGEVLRLDLIPNSILFYVGGVDSHEDSEEDHGYSTSSNEHQTDDSDTSTSTDDNDPNFRAEHVQPPPRAFTNQECNQQ